MSNNLEGKGERQTGSLEVSAGMKAEHFQVISYGPQGQRS
jgi:hypothetical protein